MSDSFRITTTELMFNDEGDGIRVTRVDQPLYGSLTFDATAGIIVYAPPQPEFDSNDTLPTSDTFDYTITDAYGRTDTATVTVRLFVPEGDPEPVPTPPTGRSAARLVQTNALISTGGQMYTTNIPEVGNLLIAVLTRATDADGSAPRDPLTGWTVLGKSAPHDRVATTVVYRYVDAAYQNEVDTTNYFTVFADSPNNGATTIILWEFEAAPDIIDAIPDFLIQVADTSAFTSQQLTFDLPASNYISTTTARGYTATASVSGGDHASYVNSTDSTENRRIYATKGTIEGGPVINVTGCEQVSFVSIAVSRFI